MLDGVPAAARGAPLRAGRVGVALGAEVADGAAGDAVEPGVDALLAAAEALDGGPAADVVAVPEPDVAGSEGRAADAAEREAVVVGTEDARGGVADRVAVGTVEAVGVGDAADATTTAAHSVRG